MLARLSGQTPWQEIHPIDLYIFCDSKRLIFYENERRSQNCRKQAAPKMCQPVFLLESYFLSMPYVWGGSSPSTSFDCSGFVCWVINNSGNGWSVGRTTANGLRGKCSYVSPADAQPGDLIFFEKTYNTVGASHVGIYVGNGMMIHCGDPISYTSINSTYWQSHFLGFGRIN